MSGGAFTIYSGARRHRGGSLLGSLSRFVAPLGRQAFTGIRKLAQNKTVRNIAKQAIAKGAEAAANVTADALQGRNVADALKQHSKQAVVTVLDDTMQSPPPPPRKLKQKKARTGKVVTYSPITPQKRKRSGAPKPRGIKRKRKRSSSRSSPPSKQRKRSLSRSQRQRKELF